MTATPISGTENYAEEAPELLKRYESISFADAHAQVLHLIPPAPCRVLLALAPGATRQVSRPWGTRSSPSNRLKSFEAARCCCIRRR